MSFKTDYETTHGGTIAGATAFCRDLMRSDPATYHRGYTADNALICAVVHFEMIPFEASEVAARIGADVELALKAAA